MLFLNHPHPPKISNLKGDKKLLAINLEEFAIKIISMCYAIERLSDPCQNKTHC